MKKYFTLLVLLMIVFACNNKVKAQSYPQWYCMSHDEIIWDMAFDHTLVWIGTRGGLVKLDRVTGTKSFYNAANSPLYGNEVKAVEVDDSGNVWIGMYYGDLVKYDGTNWTHYWTLNGTDSLFGIQEIHKDNTGNIYVAASGNSGGGMYKFDGTNFINLAPPTNYFFSFAIDSINNLWCTTYYALLKFDGSTWIQYDTTNSPIPVGSPYSIAIDKNNSVWIGVSENASNYYKIYNLHDTTWTYVTPAMSGIPLSSSTWISQDDSGNIYFYGYINGIINMMV